MENENQILASLSATLKAEPRLDKISSQPSLKEAEMPLNQFSTIQSETLQSPTKKSEEVSFKSELPRQPKLNRSMLAGPVQKSKAKKKNAPVKEFERAHVLYNLFLGVSITAKHAKRKDAPVKYRFGVGPGNNDKLIEKLLRCKGMEFENFFYKCNVVWTQVTSKRTAIASVGAGVEVMDLMDDNTPQKVRAFKIKSAEALENQILALKLFKVSDKNLVREIAEYQKARSKLTVIKADSFRLLNHIKGLKYISRKHMLFDSIRKYCESNSIPIDSVVPQTWVLSGDTFDNDLETMLAEKSSSKDGFKHPLIIKPGENSNRGQGITIAFDKQQARKLCTDVLESRKNTSTVVVQTYITNPLLFLKRKFDLRCYALVHRLPGRLSYFWYTQGYARTCSYEYSPDVRDNLMVHLTNEAVQVKGRPA